MVRGGEGLVEAGEALGQEKEARKAGEACQRAAPNGVGV